MMINLLTDLYWPLTVGAFLLLAHRHLNRWHEAQKPLALVQYQELDERLQDLQDHVSTLMIRRGFE